MYPFADLDLQRITFDAIRPDEQILIWLHSGFFRQGIASKLLAISFKSKTLHADFARIRMDFDAMARAAQVSAPSIEHFMNRQMQYLTFSAKKQHFMTFRYLGHRCSD